MATKPVLERKSTGPCGEVIWWYDEGRRIRRVSRIYSSDGKPAYFAEWHPYRGIYFTRIQPARSLADARQWLRHAYLPGREAITATGKRFVA